MNELTVDKTIRARLREALEAEQIPLEPEWGELGDDVSLDADVGLDSFQLMKVARHLEKAYDFGFSLADWVLEEEERDGPAYTIGALLAFVRRHLEP